MIEILIIKLGAAGDILRTTAILEGLHEKYPNSEIDWLTERNMAPLLEKNKHLRNIWFTDHLGFMERYGYDLVISSDDDMLACKLATEITSKKLIGGYISRGKRTYTPDSRLWFDMGLTSRFGKKKADKLKTKNKKTYQEIWYTILGMPYKKQEPHFNLHQGDIRFANQFAKKNNIKKSDYVIGINPGSGARWWDKQLSIEDTIEFVNHLKKKHPNAKTILLGGSSEMERNKAIIQALPHLINAGHTNSLRKFAAIISLCSVVVTSDSLAMHMATALKKKSIVFFGPTSPWEIELYDRGHHVLPISGCLACYRPQCKVPPKYNLEKMAQLV